MCSKQKGPSYFKFILAAHREIFVCSLVCMKLLLSPSNIVCKQIKGKRCHVGSVLHRWGAPKLKLARVLKPDHEDSHFLYTIISILWKSKLCDMATQIWIRQSSIWTNVNIVTKIYETINSKKLLLLHTCIHRLGSVHFPTCIIWTQVVTYVTFVCNAILKCRLGAPALTPYLVYLFTFHTLYTKVWWHRKMHRKLYLLGIRITSVIPFHVFWILQGVYKYISFIRSHVIYNNSRICVWWYQQLYENSVSLIIIYRKL